MTTITLGYKALHHRVKSVWVRWILQKLADLLALKIRWKLILLTGILFLVLMLVFYVFSINQLTGGTYLIKQYNKDFALALNENKKLQATFAENGFLGNIQERTKDLYFEKTAKIKYIQITESSLASVSKSVIE